MRPIRFPECNMTWAADQPPYLPLPAYADDEMTISCWRLSWKERFIVLFTGRLWLRQINGTEALQPQSASVRTPFRRAYDGGPNGPAS